jgi:Tol biopolymer transport system component
MKFRLTCLAIAVVAAVAFVSADQSDAARTQMEAARKKEVVDGDLKTAIQQYQAIAEKYKGDHAVAADALVRLAACYEKLGDRESKRVYERLIREYGDQKDAIAIARARLGNGDALAQSKGDRAVWTGPKVDVFGRVSPDGRYVTYADWQLYGNLAVHDVPANADYLLTHKKTWDDLDGAESGWSAISPDGKQVAYGWEAKDKDIRIIALDPSATAEPRRLVKFSGADVRFLGVRDWSADGKWLAIGLARTDGTAQIGIASVADGSFTVLKSTDWRGADRIAFSSDSKYIAYDLPASDAADQRDVFVLAIDGSRETPVVVHNADDLVVGWSPDGKHLLFSSDRTGSKALWAVSVVDGKPSDAAELLKSDIGADSYPLGLTRSGGLFVYKNISSRDVKIASIDLNAGKLVGQTVHFPQGYLAAPQDPHWSPDGKYLVYQVRGEHDGLAIRSVDTGAVRRLTRKLLYARDPRWSPDGSSLIVGGRDGKGRDGIYRIEVDSGNFTPIVYTSGLGAEPRWSADGTKILYKDRQQVERVVERDLASGAEREIFRQVPNRTQGSGLVVSPASSLQNFEVSPDGRSLAVQTQIDATTKYRSLFVVSIADGSSVELLRLTSQESVGQLHAFAWMPDSRAILFRKRIAGQPELWAIDVATAKLRRFDVDATDWKAAMLGPGTDSLDGGFSLSPNGKHIAFLMGKSGAEVWALENFLPSPTANKQTAKKYCDCCWPSRC